MVDPCDGQVEVDHYWAALTEGGGRAVRMAEGSFRPVVADRAEPVGSILGDPDPGHAARALEAICR